MVLQPIPALCKSTILSLTSLDSSLVLAMGESLESDWFSASVDRLYFIQVTSWDCQGQQEGTQMQSEWNKYLLKHKFRGVHGVNSMYKRHLEARNLADW